MTREELVNLRQQVYEEYRRRVQLGEFDANASAIQLCLHTLVDILGMTLEEMKKNEKNLRTKRKNIRPKVENKESGT